MRQTNGAAGLLCVAFVGAIAATCALAQPANEREVMMMRQDFSDCGNGDVRDADPALQRGVAWVVRGADGTTRVKVAMTATPNTTYHFFLKCVRHLGDVTTDEEGVGLGALEFPTNSAGDAYAFDMYPAGAPAGDKFQSIQVRF